MPKLIYAAITSLDGYMEDMGGGFDWAVPDAEVHAFINELERHIGTHLYGRRMYETMAVWQTFGDEPGLTEIEADFAEMWRTLDKVVYSRTLDAVWTPRTRLEREFDPEARAPHEGCRRSRPQHQRPRIGAARVQGRSGGRSPQVCVPGRGGRRQAGTPPGSQGGTRAGRRAALRQRRGPPALPHAMNLSDLIARVPNRLSRSDGIHPQRRGSIG